MLIQNSCVRHLTTVPQDSGGCPSRTAELEVWHCVLRLDCEFILHWTSCFRRQVTLIFFLKLNRISWLVFFIYPTTISTYEPRSLNPVQQRRLLGHWWVMTHELNGFCFCFQAVSSQVHLTLWIIWKQVLAMSCFFCHLLMKSVFFSADVIRISLLRWFYNFKSPFLYFTNTC